MSSNRYTGLVMGTGDGLEAGARRAAPEPPRRVTIGSVEIGGARPTVIAGPCSVEPGYVRCACQVAATGVDGLRAGVFKPRTRPESFQGLGPEAIPLLDEARRTTGLPLLSEVLGPADAELLAGHVDGFQVGARNMQNFRLLETLGDMGRPVVLKRGMGATVEEWIAASEYIRRRGNDDVVLCERGIRTFEPSTRCTLDLSSVVVAREHTDLPVLVDPSHAAGRRRWVLPLARAALAVGADGVLLEAHPDPAGAWSDGDQAVDLPDCARVVAETHRHAGRRTPGGDADGDAGTGGAPGLAELDAEIAELVRLRAQRAGAAAR